VSAFVAALQFLTIWPWPRRATRSSEEIGSSAIFFPVVGLLLGSVLALLDLVVGTFASPGVTAVLVVALLAWLTRGLHLDGLADTFDGLGAGGDRERMLRIMDDSHTGAFGLIAIVIVLFLKIHALESIETGRWRALLTAPILARWAMALLAYRSQPAKPGLGAAFLEYLNGKHVLIATIITLILVGALLGGVAIALAVWVALLSFVSKQYFHRRLGGITGDTFGALGELSEASVLAILALGLR
jgi:adenosylcobinamide-GDP ribazoletransferase